METIIVGEYTYELNVFGYMYETCQSGTILCNTLVILLHISSLTVNLKTLEKVGTIMNECAVSQAACLELITGLSLVYSCKFSCKLSQIVQFQYANTLHLGVSSEHHHIFIHFTQIFLFQQLQVTI